MAIHAIGLSPVGDSSDKMHFREPGTGGILLRKATQNWAWSGFAPLGRTKRMLRQKATQVSRLSMQFGFFDFFAWGLSSGDSRSNEAQYPFLTRGGGMRLTCIMTAFENRTGLVERPQWARTGRKATVRFGRLAHGEDIRVRTVERQL